MKMVIIAVCSIGAVCLLGGALAWFFLRKKKSAQAAQPLTRLERTEQAFAHMRARTKLKLDGPLLWGFLFTHPSKAPLEELGRAMEQAGYRIRAFYPDIKGGTWNLQAGLVAQHEPATLAQREENLLALAGTFGVSTYNGWDVETVPAVSIEQPATRQQSLEERIRARSNGRSFSIEL